MKWVYSLTLFVGAALLFLLELIFAKMLLPTLGGSAAVWVTALLFFQTVLLAGYAYGHATVRRLGARRQAAVHVVLSFVPLLLLPFAIPDGWAPPTQGTPVWWVLLLLTAAVGLPFFVVASTAPLLQSWFAQSGHRCSHDPYFLYRASNLGSLLGLLAYPFLIEPTFTLGEQRIAWAVGYAVLLALMIVCAVLLWRAPATARADVARAAVARAEAMREGIGERESGNDAAERVSRGRKVRWLLLAFVPSSLLLGVTSYLTSDLAPLPLLWVVPLALYLVSFIFVFSPRHARVHGLMVRMLPFFVVPTLVIIALRIGHLLWIAVPIYLIAFFLAAMVCHGQLAQDRPSAGHLTSFYLWIALGGVLGATVNVLLAPALFTSFIEVPLMFVAALFVRPDLRPQPRLGTRKTDRRAALIVGGIFLVCSLAALGSPPSAELLYSAMFLVVSGLVCLSFTDRARRFALCIAVILVVSLFVPLGRIGEQVLAERNFFGTFRVIDDTTGGERLLFHGNTVHGAQSLDPDTRLEPRTYFTPSSPVGGVFQAQAGKTARVGVVGLGVGSLACYASATDYWTFYEIDPDLAEVAQDPAYFTFMSECPGQRDVVLGDGRRSLAQVPDATFDILVLDAFNSDAVPLHLLTREALAEYERTLKPDGLLVFNVTNRYLDIAPALGDLAGDAGMVAFGANDLDVSEAERDTGKAPSRWVVMAREPAHLHAVLSGDDEWQVIDPRPGQRVWTDDFSNLLSALDLG